MLERLSEVLRIDLILIQCSDENCEIIVTICTILVKFPNTIWYIHSPISGADFRILSTRLAIDVSRLFGDSRSETQLGENLDVDVILSRANNQASSVHPQTQRMSKICFRVLRTLGCDA